MRDRDSQVPIKKYDSEYYNSKSLQEREKRLIGLGLLFAGVMMVASANYEKETARDSEQE